LSKTYEENPYQTVLQGKTFLCITRLAEWQQNIWGNSNWRGPIWLPVNYLILESVRRFYQYFGDDLRVEYPTRSGNFISMWNSRTVVEKWLEYSSRWAWPTAGFGIMKVPEWSHFRDYILFWILHGDTGAWALHIKQAGLHWLLVCSSPQMRTNGRNLIEKIWVVKSNGDLYIWWIDDYLNPKAKPVCKKISKARISNHVIPRINSYCFAWK
jgi:hypothetical protein